MSWTNETKNASTFTEVNKLGVLSFITTDTPDFVLVGGSEDLFLIWDEPAVWSVITNTTSSWTNLAKS